MSSHDNRKRFCLTAREQNGKYTDFLGTEPYLEYIRTRRNSSHPGE